MKTALIKTNIWDDDLFYDLNIDTKIIYLLLLTSPERGVGRTFKMTDRIITARSGLNQKQISICKSQLQELGVAFFFDGWVNLTDKSSFVQPVKGKLTEITLARELKDIPVEVSEHFYNLTEVISPVTDQSVTIVTPVHDNVNDDDEDNVPVNDSGIQIFGKSEINELFDNWEEVVGYKITGNMTKNRYAANNLFKKHGLDGVQKLIRGVHISQTDKYAPRISDFVSLQSKYNDLLAWGKRTGNQSAKIASF